MCCWGSPCARRPRLRRIACAPSCSSASKAIAPTPILKALRGYPEVRALHTTNGRWDIVAELGADSLESFDEVLRSIRTIKGISNSETSLLLSTHKV